MKTHALKFTIKNIKVQKEIKLIPLILQYLNLNAANLFIFIEFISKFQSFPSIYNILCDINKKN